MVLMGILAVVREDEVGRDAFQLLESVLYLGAFKRHEAVPELLQDRPSQLATREQTGGAPRFLRANACGAEHHPVEDAPGILPGQPQDGSAATDFDIV